VRLFFGFSLGIGEALALDDWRQHNTHCDGNAVPVANFHITLAFIGEMSENRLEALIDRADGLLEGTQTHKAELPINSVGYWPKPGVFWVGPDQWPEEMSRLAASLKHLAMQFGARKDRSPFQPHITLFRRCQAAPAAPAVPPCMTVQPTAVTLFESRQGRQGVSYHSLADWA